VIVPVWVAVGVFVLVAVYGGGIGVFVLRLVGGGGSTTPVLVSVAVGSIGVLVSV
jgi:hypothetical protein